MAIHDLDDPREVIVATATAANDTAYGKENRTISGNVTANDTPPPVGPALVYSVNGSTLDVGRQITLASGALLTLNRDGSYSYDPNHKFDYLVSAATAAATGALDSTATDSFSYALDGGSTATVTMTVRGVDGAGDQLRGDAGNNAIYGTGADDIFNVSQGGDDTVAGGAGNDTFYFGAAFSFRDQIDGGEGVNTVVLQGNYSTLLYGPALANIERITLLSGSDTSFGDTAGNAYTYTLSPIEFFNGGTLKVNASALGANEHLNFDGSEEHGVALRIIGGAGSDTITGGASNDSLVGGGGADIFRYNGNSGQDTIGDFTPGTDKIDLQVTFYHSFSEVMSHTQDVEGNAVIDLGSTDKMILIGVTKAQLQAGDFLYYADNFAIGTGTPVTLAAHDAPAVVLHDALPVSQDGFGAAIDAAVAQAAAMVGSADLIADAAMPDGLHLSHTLHHLIGFDPAF